MTDRHRFEVTPARRARRRSTSVRVRHAVLGATFLAVAPVGMPARCTPGDEIPAVPVAAITSDGTAIYQAAGGEPIELRRDGPGSAELHSVTVTPDGRRAWVTECCEPVWGRWWEIAVGDGPVEPDPRAGYGFDLSPDATQLASIGFFELAVRDLDGEFIARVDLLNDPISRDPYGAVWIDDDRLAVVELAQPESGNEFRLVATDDDLHGYLEAQRAVIGTDLDAPWPQLAGVTEGGEILVLQGRGPDATSRRLHAYDPETLQRRPHADVRLPRPATAAWVDGPHVLWIDRQERLFVDGDHLPGHYVWARTQ